MTTIDFFHHMLRQMTAEDLHALGEAIGSLSKDFPDRTHQVMVGIRDGIMTSGSNPTGYGFGSILEDLQRHAAYSIPRNAPDIPLIPFDTRSRPSGIGLSSTKT